MPKRTGLVFGSWYESYHRRQLLCTSRSAQGKGKLPPRIVKSYIHRIGNKSSAVAEMGDRGHNRQEGGCCAPFAESWDPIQYNVAWAEVYFRSVPSGVFIRPAVTRKLGAVPLLGGGELRTHLTQRRLSQLYN